MSRRRYNKQNWITLDLFIFISLAILTAVTCKLVAVKVFPTVTIELKSDTVYAAPGEQEAETATITVTPTLRQEEQEAVVVTPTYEVTDEDLKKSDELVGKYIEKYVTNERVGDDKLVRYMKSKMRARMQCLLFKEAVHNNSKGHGDHGMAGGPLQFWEQTYIGYRKLMIKEGFVTEIGSRYDLDNAIETAVWATTSGREKAWGPVLRGECL